MTQQWDPEPVAATDAERDVTAWMDELRASAAADAAADDWFCADCDTRHHVPLDEVD